MSISIDELYTNLFGKSQLDILTCRGTQLCLAFFHRFNIIHNLGDCDTLFFNKICTRHNGKKDGFVDTGASWFGIRNLDWDINRGDYRYIVSSFLSNFFAVFAISSIAMSMMTVTMMSISTMSRLADSDHLDISLLLERDLNSLGSGVFVLFVVRVSTDFVGNLIDAFSTDSASDIVAKFLINDAFDGQIDSLTYSFKGGCADISNFSHISNSAIVLGCFVTITTIGRCMMTVSRGMMMVSRCRFVRSRCRFVRCRCRFIRSRSRMRSRGISIS